MIPRGAGLVLLAAAVVLAGCGSGAPTGTAAPGETDASPAGTATASSTPSLSDLSFPAGVSQAGVENRSALLDAHARALAGRSVTVDISFTLSVNGTGQDVDVSAAVAPGSDRGWLRVDLADGSAEYYTEAGTTYAKVTTESGTTYGTTDAVSAVPETPRFGADRRIADALAAANWTADGVVVRDGTRLVRLVATDVTLPSGVDVEGGNATATSTGTLLVDESGVVREIAVRTRVETATETVVYGIEVRLSAIGGTTVTEPDWLGKAEENASG